MAKTSPTDAQLEQLFNFVKQEPDHLEPGQAEDLAAVVVSSVLPRSWNTFASSNPVYKGIADKFTTWERLPAGASRILISGYLTFMEKGEPQVIPGKFDDDEGLGRRLHGEMDRQSFKAHGDFVLRQLENKNLSVADMGSAWRHQCYMDGGWPANVMTKRIYQMSDRTPVEMIAQVLLEQGPLEPPYSSDFQLSPEEFRKRASQKYPDLVEIPYQLLLETVATQPLPEEWSVNMWDVPTMVTSVS